MLFSRNVNYAQNITYTSNLFSGSSLLSDKRGFLVMMFVYSLYFNFNLIQRALVLEDYAPALGVAGFVSRKKGARSKGKEEKEGKK